MTKPAFFQKLSQGNHQKHRRQQSVPLRGDSQSDKRKDGYTGSDNPSVYHSIMNKRSFQCPHTKDNCTKNRRHRSNTHAKHVLLCYCAPCSKYLYHPRTADNRTYIPQRITDTVHHKLAGANTIIPANRYGIHRISYPPVRGQKQ